MNDSSETLQPNRRRGKNRSGCQLRNGRMPSTRPLSFGRAGSIFVVLIFMGARSTSNEENTQEPEELAADNFSGTCDAAEIVRWGNPLARGGGPRPSTKVRVSVERCAAETALPPSRSLHILKGVLIGCEGLGGPFLNLNQSG